MAVTGRWEGEQLQIGWGALIEVTFLRLEKRVGQATICRRNISGRGKSKCKTSRQAMCLVCLGTSLSADGQGYLPTLVAVLPEAS